MNLLNLIQSQISPQALNQISSAVGENPEGTRAAFGTALPALVASVIGKASASPNGPNEVYNMVQEGQQQGGWFDSASGMLSSLGSGGYQLAGNSLLNSLLGPKLGAVGSFLASHCGIKASSASAILSMAAPLLMGTIGKQVSSQGLGAAGLGQLLSSQTQYLKDAIPSGLANTLGIGNLLGGAPGAERPEMTAAPSYARAAQPEHAYARGAQGEPAHAGQSTGSKVLRYAGILMVLALAGWFIASRTHKTPAAGGTANFSGTEVQSGRAASTPDLQSLNLAPGSTADQVAKAVASGNFGQPFSFAGVNFDSAGDLTASSQSQLQQLGSVLNAASDLKVTITAYGPTDATGSSRAEAMKSDLVDTGVAADRITTVGGTGTEGPSLRVVP